MLANTGARGQAPSGVGAYGFEIEGLHDGDRLLGPAEPGWPRLQVVRDEAGGDPPADVAPGTVTMDDESAAIWLTGTDRILIDRASFTVRFATGVRLEDEVIAHPYIALPASIASRWLGRQILHAAAFLHAGKAWALLGEKEAGKSSLVGWLHHRGYEILTDDILVVEGAAAFSGPRCVDLRPESAAVLGGEDVGMLGNRVRWRLRPGAVPSSTPLAGLVHLKWGE